MGLLDKARTKARVTPVVIRSPLPFDPNGSWRLQNGIAASALVRGAFAQVETQRLNSGTLRGRQGSLSRFANSQASCLWYVQSDDAMSWHLRLGVRSSKTGDYYLDWSVQVDCRDESGAVEAGIQTPSYLMLDHTLVNGDAHDRLRDLLVAAFRGRDGGVGAAAEVALCMRSLQSQVVLDEPAEFSRFRDCAISTVLTDEKLGAVLRRVCMPLVEVASTRQVFRLGVDRPDVPSSLGTVTWDEARESGMRTLRLSFALRKTGSAFLDAMVIRAASSLARRLHNYVAIEDTSLHWSGPDLHSWVW